ncbi:LysR family transcriptional regulator [Sulfitobacter sp. TSTF-M16]|uniref:LysR family transcriptional regulator n=1 Tax=Sulfitobacter aestuariivivens TaxID=2766981 RepID=A0A927HGE4_9RHOB|nr:LysR family transcriptional regulator [Sulfitobacter aestuariivivens]
MFEVAARHASFTRAGEELGLSQPTVSQHIATIENRLGVRLFERHHNKLVLTVAGTSLSQAVSLGFSHVDEALRKLRLHERRSGLKLVTSISFAYGWLLPRYGELCEIAGEQIDLVIVPWIDEPPTDTADIVLNWRSRNQTGWPTADLFREVIYPVASPALATELGLVSGDDTMPDALTGAKLLSYDERPNEFLSWDQWFFQLGSERQSSSTEIGFSNYQALIQSALHGFGVALGWHHLVADLIREQRLVKCGPAIATSDYFVAATNPQSDRSQTAAAIIEDMKRMFVA